jgi:hypothetical protein
MSGASISAVLRMAYGRGSGRFIAVLGAFFDDSGTHADSSAVVIGGLLGTEEQWDMFEAAWNARLADPIPGYNKPPLKMFHLSVMRAHHDDFFTYSKAEIDHLTYLFRQIILDVGLISIAIAVNKLAWDELVTGTAKVMLGDPIEYCIVRCVELVVNTSRLRKPGEPISIFADKVIEKKLAGWPERLKSTYEEIFSVVFAPVPKVVALQGADMIATETYQYDVKWLKDRDNIEANPHFKSFVKRELSSGWILDREHIQEMVNRLQASLRIGNPVSGGQPS